MLAPVPLVASGCGGGGVATPDTPTAGVTTTASSGLVITITSAGVTPKHLVVNAGSQVTFINNDSIAHLMFSDPHPEHTDCPELNQVGFLDPGQSRQTGNLDTARTCGFHDHNLFANTSLQGSLTIQ